MFGLFKKKENKKVEIYTLINSLSNRLEDICRTIRQTTAIPSIQSSDLFLKECAALSFFIVCTGIARAPIILEKKEYLIEEIARAWATNIDNGILIESTTRLLSDRLHEYAYLGNSVEGKDYSAKIILKFLDFIGQKKPENGGIISVLHSTLLPLIETTEKFIIDVDRSGCVQWPC
ncbi:MULTISPECIES: hypothetical protein [Methylomonas]|uniref:Uncharacterized protein n=2 Tax=Methylomonas TaxID=416 RepID=A0A126T677_9GAMM|nr:MULTISPECIES: hypothetical protein [Methylomonas]AMK77579.1 hypothetical protein JT25_013990 [Methylomonas denitrificans]OAI05159.1 hypothetical protein A1342_12155 [Methylomonas methanica]TCV84378.1 hypothetical protein EDE11_10735 [Methylomonas methanica]